MKILLQITWGEQMRVEFEELKKDSDELASTQHDRLVMRADRLITIRDRLEWCDNMTDIAPMEAYILFLTADYWERCRKFWFKYKPNTEDVHIPEITLKTKKHSGNKTSKSTALVKIGKPSLIPPKSWEEEMTPKDERFLKSLKIARGDELTYPEEEDDDMA